LLSIVEDTDGWFAQGVALFGKKDYPAAIAAFDKAITYNQSPKEAWYYRGLASAQAGNLRQALHSFDQVLLHDPDDGDAKAAKAAVLEQMKKQGVTSPLPAAEPARRPPAVPPREPGREPARTTYAVRNPLLAALFSFFFTGWGQWYNGRRWAGLAFFGVSAIAGMASMVLNLILSENLIVSLFFGIIGLGVWGYSMYDAYTTAQMINDGVTGFTRKSRLFWLPLVYYALVIALILLILILILTGFGPGAVPHR
jgi:tetratricopeptide (TPR) repeat protein